MHSRNAEIAQLVERNLAKVEVAGPSPVFRSKMTTTGKVVVFLCSAVPAVLLVLLLVLLQGPLPFLLLWPGCFGRSPDAILPLLAACWLCLCGFQAVRAGEIAKIGGLELLFLGKMAKNRGENCHLGFLEGQIAKTRGLDCYFRKK